MTETNRYVRAYRSPSLEFVVNQSIWMEGEAGFADVILPACTNFERWDISEWANSSGLLANGMSQCNHRVIVLQHKCIEPLGESKSDWLIFAASWPSGLASARPTPKAATSSSGCAARSRAATSPRSCRGASSSRRATSWCRRRPSVC